MVLWQWLRDHTTNGHTYYAYGKEASLDSIVYRILDHLQHPMKQKFTIEAIHSTTCSINADHNSCRNFSHSVFTLSDDDVLEMHPLNDGSEFNVLKAIEHKLSLNNFPSSSLCSALTTQVDMSLKYDCNVIDNPKTCGARTKKSTTVTNTPDIFFVSYSNNQTIKCRPSIDHELCTNIQVNDMIYRLSGIVYLKSHHYWCEVFSSQKEYEKGWYVFNGLWNNGKATFVGPKPLFLEKDHIYLLMFEKLKASHHHTQIFNTSYKCLYANNSEIVKKVVNDHKELLSLPDSKVKLQNIKAILQYHNTPFKSNLKLDDLKDILLQQCNTTSSIPVSFVSDSDIDCCYVAPQKDKSIPYKETL
jgi:predicted metal-binding protein